MLLQLRQLIEEHRQQTEILKQICCCQRMQQQQEVVEECPFLANWLDGLGIHQSAKKMFLAEGYKLEEVLYQITRDDLRHIGLRGGTEFRIWKAIEEHRLGDCVIICNGVTTDESETV